MSVLDDFFGDSGAMKECLYCGRQDGPLVVAISDNYGPTHWTHQACRDANDPPILNPRVSGEDEMEDQ